MVDAENSNRASFGSVSAMVPLTDCSASVWPGAVAAAQAWMPPFTVCASKSLRTPLASIEPLTDPSCSSPSRSRILTSPLTVLSSAETPGGITSS